MHFFSAISLFWLAVVASALPDPQGSSGGADTGSGGDEANAQSSIAPASASDAPATMSNVPDTATSSATMSMSASSTSPFRQWERSGRRKYADWLEDSATTQNPTNPPAAGSDSGAGAQAGDGHQNLPSWAMVGVAGVLVMGGAALV